MPWQVLLVSDDVTIGAALSRADADIEITIAPDAIDALVLLRSHRFDAAICDCNDAPGDDAMLVRAARADTNTANLPILLLEAGLDDASREELFDAGIDDCVTKPMAPEKMIAALAAAIARRPAHQLAKEMAAALSSQEIRRPRRATPDVDLSEQRLAAVKEQAVKALMESANLRRQLDNAAAEQARLIEDANDMERSLRARIAELEDDLRQQRDAELELRMEVDRTLDLRESARRLYNGVLDRARDRYRAPS